MNNIKSVFLATQEQLTSEARELMGSLETIFENDFDEAISVVGKLLEIFTGLKTLEDNREALLGAVEAQARLQEARESLMAGLEALSSPLREFKRYSSVLKQRDLRPLEQLLARHSGDTSYRLEVPDTIDPLVEKLVSLVQGGANQTDLPRDSSGNVRTDDETTVTGADTTDMSGSQQATTDDLKPAGKHDFGHAAPAEPGQSVTDESGRPDTPASETEPAENSVYDFTVPQVSTTSNGPDDNGDGTVSKLDMIFIDDEH